jgi:hypothetical protein
MKARILLAAAAMLGVASLGLAAPAFAATPDKTPDSTANCFRSDQWQDWRSPDANTIYVRVHQRDVWRIDLSGGSSMLTDQTNHLITNLQNSSWICHPIDLNNMKVSDGHVTLPLFVKSLTKLTPEQVAAIPEKDRP